MTQEIGVVELASRDVDAHVHRAGVQLAESRRLGTCLREHPLAQTDDEAGLFGKRDELAGRELAGDWMLPADERLVAHDLAALEIDDRLVVESELAAGDSLPQLADPLRAVQRGAVELRIEERKSDI